MLKSGSNCASSSPSTGPQPAAWTISSTWSPPVTQPSVVVPGQYLHPRYGLTTSTVVPESNGAPDKTAAVKYGETGMDPVYGLSTGLGANLGVRLDDGDLVAFQRRILVGRAVAIGKTLPRETVRAALILRANGLARGGAGASLTVIEALLALLNGGIHPCVPSLGSIGAADLTPMAHLALPLVGAGVLTRRKRVMCLSESCPWKTVIDPSAVATLLATVSRS